MTPSARSHRDSAYACSMASTFARLGQVQQGASPRKTTTRRPRFILCPPAGKWTPAASPMRRMTLLPCPRHEANKCLTSDGGMCSEACRPGNLVDFDRVEIRSGVRRHKTRTVRTQGVPDIFLWWRRGWGSIFDSQFCIQSRGYVHPAQPGPIELIHPVDKKEPAVRGHHATKLSFHVRLAGERDIRDGHLCQLVFLRFALWICEPDACYGTNLGDGCFISRSTFIDKAFHTRSGAVCPITYLALTICPNNISTSHL